MLQQYKNKDKFIIGPNTGQRFSTVTNNLLQRDIDQTNFTESFVELHVYSGDNWITGNHNSTVLRNSDRIIQNVLKVNQQSEFNGQPIILDVFSEFRNLGLTTGNFNFVVNFFKNLIGSYQNQYLYIDEISPDRTEVKLKLINNVSNAGKSQFMQYMNLNKTSPQTSRDTYTQYLLNFSRNKTIAYVNSVVIGDFLFVKLLEPLPSDIQLQFKCWIVEEIRLPHIDFISLYPIEVKRNFNQLAGANWQIEIDGQNSSAQTAVKSWNDLLGASTSVSQQLIDKYFSGSLEGVPLNIDFRDFNNFIFYSSAEQRVINFKEKLQSLEYYDSQITTLQTISGSTATTNISDYETLKTNVVSGFDAFERYLYYESSSILTTHDVPVIEPTVQNLTGSYVFPAPKTSNTKPYTLYSTSTTQFNNWYDNLIESASYYDTYNLNRLAYSLPEATRNADEDSQLTLFTDMLGHHYDIIHSYVKQASLIYSTEENPKIGVPNDLLKYVAKQFGWNLEEGNQYQDLWQYALGTNEQGAPITGSNSVGDASVSSRDMTRHVWRRIVNNLPYILKSKGTKRSVQALLACYGIPESMITINEYGGPRSNRVPVYEKLNFDYALDLINNSAGTVTINYTKPIGSYEMRFRTDNVVTNPGLPSIMNLVTIGSNVVTLNFSSGNKGTIKINGTASANIELFDEKWLSLLLQQNGTNLDLSVKKAKYGKIVATVSASATASFGSTGTITIGGTSGGSRLQGQIQEIRLYTGSLSVSAFENHTKAPGAYDADTSTYNELVFRLPLIQKVDHNLTSSLSGAQPISSSMSASFTSWTNAIPYDSVEEIYYYDGISAAVGTSDDNKIRIEQNDLLDNTLYVNRKSEVSEYDQAALDSNRIGVYFSPQTMINEDIIAHFGYTEIDSYIGDPGDDGKYEYRQLKHVAKEYWKKYLEKNDVNSFIKIFTLFDLSFFRQLKQLLPARAEKLTGILIQPNLLERNKQHVLPSLNRTFNDYSASLSVTGSTIGDHVSLLSSDISLNTNISSSYESYESIGTLTQPLNLIGSFSSNLTMNLTQSSENRYKSFTYSYNYLVLSGSTFITASSPYWRNEAFVSAITSSVLSEFLTKIETYISGGITYKISSSMSNVTDFKPAGIANAYYNGCKISSPGFNLPSADTYEGKPVVEIIDVNPNQIIYNNTTTTNPVKP